MHRSTALETRAIGMQNPEEESDSCCQQKYRFEDSQKEGCDPGIVLNNVPQ